MASRTVGLETSNSSAKLRSEGSFWPGRTFPSRIKRSIWSMMTSAARVTRGVDRYPFIATVSLASKWSDQYINWSDQNAQTVKPIDPSALGQQRMHPNYRAPDRPSPSAFRVLMTPNAATSKRSDIWRTRDFHRAHSERHPDLQLQCDLTAVRRLMPPHQPSGREQY